MQRLISAGRARRRSRSIFTTREKMLKSSSKDNDAIVAHMDVTIGFKTMGEIRNVDALIIRDTGSPVSIVKRSRVPDNTPIRPYDGRTLYGASQDA